MRGHTLLDHTGDLGFVARAESVEGVFEESARALFALILEEIDRVDPISSVAIDLDGAVDREDLLVRFLGELLWLHDARDWVFSRVRVDSLTGDTLRAEAFGEPFDPARHRIARQVKAVTYHHLLLSEDREGWTARVILDL